MKLCQGQIWKQGNEYIRVVRLERLEVEYKSMPAPDTKEGTLHHTSKKDFCRLLKQARLLQPAKNSEPARDLARDCDAVFPSVESPHGKEPA